MIEFFRVYTSESAVSCGNNRGSSSIFAHPSPRSTTVTSSSPW